MRIVLLVQWVRTSRSLFFHRPGLNGSRSKWRASSTLLEHQEQRDLDRRMKRELSEIHEQIQRGKLGRASAQKVTRLTRTLRFCELDEPTGDAEFGVGWEGESGAREEMTSTKPMVRRPGARDRASRPS